MKKIIYILFLLLFSKLTFCQNVSEKIIAALDSFSYIEPHEKAYLQTDRNAYLAGESIFFKAYILFDEKPTVLSKIVYAELVDKYGQIVEKKMLPIEKGIAIGNFNINPSTADGIYFIKCYTLWMLNMPDFIFEKKVIVYNRKVSDTITTYVSPKVECRFFPEGGDLVNGIKSKIAFKATLFAENNKNFTATLIDNNNNKIESFKSIHNDMGFFELTPEQGKSYRVLLNYPPSKDDNIFPLPIAKNEGIVISTDNSNLNKVFIKLERSDNNKAFYNNLIVAAQMNTKIVYIGKLNFDEGLDAMAISKKSLPAGIMQITVFDESGNPLAERLVFIANHNLNKDLIKSKIINVVKREKNTLEIDLKEYTNPSASISVINTAAENFSASTNILSALLLTNDLKGDIYNSKYYFNDKELMTLNHLDLVMMTNGWRRFKWSDIINNKFLTPKYPFERSLTVSGNIFQSNGKSILKSSKINLIINGEDSTKIMSEAIANSKGEFYIDNINFKKEATIYYQGSNVNNKEGLVSVKINSSYFDLLKKVSIKANQNYYSEYSLVPLDYFGKLMNQKNILANGKNKTLETVVVKTKKISLKDSLDMKYATDIFYESDQTIPVNTNVNTGDILQFLSNMIPGIDISRINGESRVNFSRYQGLSFFSENGETGIQFFLNEVPVNIAVIESLFAEDIGLVKVFKGNTAIALGATRGAIALYTVKGKVTKDWRTKGFDFVKKLGYSVVREFNEIDYSIIKPESEFKDERTTLYWNPNITVKDGKALIEFYNDDVCKKFKVIVEGIDSDGKLLYEEKEIE
jgi:hypothetical protein